jgi:serine O-acetyltransferase
LFEIIRADFARHYKTFASSGPIRGRIEAAFEYGFLVTLVYRYGIWARSIHPRLLSYPFKALYLLLRTLADILFTTRIQLISEIAPGLCIAHHGGTWICGKIGRNCTIAQGVTIGSKGAGKSDGWPEIGDDVYIGAGAAIIGKVKVGNNVAIGANTTVVRDVPDNTTVVSAAVRMFPRDP